MKPLPAVADRLTQRIRIASAGLFAAASLCLLLQADDPLWLDELHTVWTARGSWSEIAERGALGNQSPPFFLMEALVGRAFGFGPQAMRSLSVLAGAVAIVVLFRAIAHRSGSIATALALACTPLIWPTLVFYFVEARPYALVFLASTILWTSLTDCLAPVEVEAKEAELRRQVARSRAGWVAGLSAAVWLHPTALLLAPATALSLAVGALSPRSRANYSIRARIADFVLASTFCALNAPFWLALYERRGAWSAFIRKPSVFDWIFDFQLLSLVALPAAALAVAAILENCRKKKVAVQTRPSLAGIGFFLLAFAIPVLIASFATWTDAARVYHFRYLIGAAAALPLFAATAIAAISPVLPRGAATALLIGSLCWFSGGASTLRHTGRIAPASRSEDWAGLAERLNELPGGPIVLDADVIESKRWAESDDPTHREYLAFALRAFPSMEHRRIQSISYDSRDEVTLRPETVAEAQASGNLYAVVRGSDAAPTKILRRLRGRLPPGFNQPRTIESFGRVWLIVYAREDAAT